MSNKRSAEGWSAPGHAPSEDWLRVPGRDDPLPGVDERLVRPETRSEMLHGIELFAAPAQPPHAMQHFDLTYVLGAHVAKGFHGAVDMLTRTGHTSDFAPDASVFSTEIDPSTGTRRLEEMAFEVCSEQPLGVPTDKARELANRGVRRVFCVVVKHRRVLEWDREADTWRTLHDDGAIEDKCLVKAIPIRALLDATSADDAVVEALKSRNAAALIRLQGESEAIGRKQGEEVGRKQGEEVGRKQGLLLAARKLLEAGESAARVAELLGLSMDEVRSL